MSTPSAITVIIRGEILRGSPEPPSGAGRGRGRGMSPNWAEKLTDNLWCLEVGAHTGPPTSWGPRTRPGYSVVPPCRTAVTPFCQAEPVRDLSIR